MLEAGYEARLVQVAAAPRAHRPRVWIKLWDEPQISGIGFVSELVAVAGGVDVTGLSQAQGARDRIVTAEAVIAAAQRRHPRRSTCNRVLRC